ncbi:MAG TPA: lipoyl(octanoyl) transferase LipB [Gammaproteobacteria bacterium]|nr:lipoyl(octanoyl) transferase LipB [Gammaproteobacteria bacterium]
MKENLIVRLLGRQDYLSCFEAMKQFTQERDEHTIDEIWLLEHNPVFTQGQNGKSEHVLDPGNIPVIPVDRGGQVTYHGPGQLVVYTLVDLRRKKLNVREIVMVLEKSVIQVLENHQLTASAKREAPGVYIDNKKICSIGLRIKKGCSYHGLAFNISMDLEPFSRINPCGYKQLKMTQLADFKLDVDIKTVEKQLIDYLTANLGYNMPLTKIEL